MNIPSIPLALAPAPQPSPQRRLKALGAVLLAGAAMGAAAQTTNTVSATGSAGTLFDVSNTAASIQAGTPWALAPVWTDNLGREAHYGAASGPGLNLHALTATRGESNQVQTVSSFVFDTVVAGAHAGDPVTVTLAFRIDGRVATGFGVSFDPAMVVGLPGEYTFESTAGVSLRLDAYDLDSPGYERGAPLARIQYGASAGVQVSRYGPSPSYPSGAQGTLRGHGVQLDVRDPNAGDWAWSGNGYVNLSEALAGPVKEDFAIDTGWMSLSFDTAVGNHLSFEGTMSADAWCFTNATGQPSGPSCEGIVDYSRTFDAELSADVAGVTFTDYVPGVAPAVPEPSTWALMIAGAGILLRRAQARARAA